MPLRDLRERLRLEGFKSSRLIDVHPRSASVYAFILGKRDIADLQLALRALNWRILRDYNPFTGNLAEPDAIISRGVSLKRLQSFALSLLSVLCGRVDATFQNFIQAEFVKLAKTHLSASVTDDEIFGVCRTVFINEQ
jgi:hypothetical protein